MDFKITVINGPRNHMVKCHHMTKDYQQRTENHIEELNGNSSTKKYNNKKLTVQSTGVAAD